MTTTRIDDTQAIEQVLGNLYEAWTAGDAHTFVADYAPDATVIQPGVFRRDRAAVQQGMAGAFAGPLANSTVTDEVQDVRFLGPEHAIVISKSAIVFPGETELPADRYVLATWVLHKQDDRWTIAAYHNSPAVAA